MPTSLGGGGNGHGRVPRRRRRRPRPHGRGPARPPVQGPGAGRLGQPARRRPRPGGRRRLAELGVDLGLVATEPPTAALLDGAELVVVMGYDPHDPARGRRTEDWCIDDPRGKGADAVRCIRDAIDRRVQRLLIRMGVALPTRPT